MVETQEEQQKRTLKAKLERYHRLHCLVMAFDLVSAPAQRLEEWEQSRKIYLSLQPVIDIFADEYFSSLMGWEDGKEHWIRTVQREIFVQAYVLSYTHTDIEEWEFLFRSNFEAHVVLHLFKSGLVAKKYMSGPETALAVMKYVNDIVGSAIRGEYLKRFLAPPDGDESELLLEFHLDAVFEQFRPEIYDQGRCEFI